MSIICLDQGIHYSSCLDVHYVKDVFVKFDSLDFLQIICTVVGSTVILTSTSVWFTLLQQHEIDNNRDILRIIL